MGYDFDRTCRTETKKVVWLIGLVVVSVVIIQYFELPYRDGVLSLLSTGKGYFSSSVGNNGDIGLKEKQSSPKNNNSSPPSMIPKLGELGRIPEENVVEEIAEEMNERSISIAPDIARNISDKFDSITDISPSVVHHGEETTASKSETRENFAGRPLKSSDFALAPEEAHRVISGEILGISASPRGLDISLAPMISPSQSISPINMNLDHVGVPTVAYSPVPIHANGNAANTSSSGKKSEILENNHSTLGENSSVSNSPPPPPKEKPKIPMSSVVSISEMNDMLLRSRLSSFSKSPLWPSKADQELLEVRFQIKNAAIITNHPSLYAPIYRNLSRFVRSYELMEQKLKVYIYKDGKKPVFHQPKLGGIYASEGWFMKTMEANNQFTTTNPEEAHLFYLPFSSQMLASYVYVPNSHSFDSIIRFLKNYTDTIKTRYPFWNRTDGADHFLVACHDWGTYESKHHMGNCIRALCNADLKEGFQFGKDVSLPETFVQSPKNPSKEIGGQPPSQRKILAFFAGQMHGYVRPILLKYWKNKDPEMKIFGKLEKGYSWHMKNSKYCICARGYEVNSPRVVEAIMYECVPVIISDNFVPPFFEILNWESFAVFVLEKDIPNLKNILVSISERRYIVMQKRVKQVRQHFLWHSTPVKYDIFHMILHSIWYNRVFRQLPG